MPCFCLFPPFLYCITLLAFLFLYFIGLSSFHLSILLVHSIVFLAFCPCFYLSYLPSFSFLPFFHVSLYYSIFPPFSLPPSVSSSIFIPPQLSSSPSLLYFILPFLSHSLSFPIPSLSFRSPPFLPFHLLSLFLFPSPLPSFSPSSSTAHLTTHTPLLPLLPGAAPVPPLIFEMIIEHLEETCWENIHKLLKTEESLSIEFDEDVICDVCRSVSVPVCLCVVCVFTYL